ncbi:MAG: helicase-exonuclease AddAB subunit AddA [Oscillospiraceae bacterium]|nr:helicase-exonuclease AddAB subunit AddA [Oscillospiraceae bacterium]
MGEKPTAQQQMAIENRGGNLLVSAAAGSGKTKVLVDRLLGYLTDPVKPANLDEFLIITYTKAAASELRGKIAAKLTEQIAQNPENRHLQRQLQRLYLTQISTVHGFCGEVLRDYAYLMDISADFRVADEIECSQLRSLAMDRVLEEAYEGADTNEDFRAFMDIQGLGRDDRQVPEILLKVYDSARCHLDPDGWLENCIRSAQTEKLTDAAETPWGQYLMADLKNYLALQIRAMENCAKKAEQAGDMEKPALLLRDTVYQLQQLADSETWDQVLERKDIHYGTLSFSKKIADPELAERIKAVRTACKKGLERKLLSFSDVSAVVLTDMEEISGAVRGMVKLVRQFGEVYDRAKRSRRVLDFGDLEHKTLDLLLGKSRSGPTAAAGEIGDRFREILVDEYQDSNAVQDRIFSALTQKRQNCFMVGDVKQSIYQFRLADPEIFLEKYQTYVPAEDAKPMEGRKILLSENFRSGGSVLAGVNDVFRLCMTPQVGGLVYGEEEALREGVPHEPLGEPEVEFWAVSVNEEQYPEEAAFVAQRIRQLLDGTHFVRSKEGLRPIVAEDIAILLRSPGSTGGYFREALTAAGIPYASGGGDNLLQTEEVSVFRAILQTVSNPRQDIPLIAALSSPVFGFTADDLAAFRSKNRHSSVYEALLLADSPKAVGFLKTLELLRRQARLQPLTGFLDTVLEQTRLDSLYAAMPAGELRTANLQDFYHLAMAFEANGPRDLEQFLEHLDALEAKGVVTSGAEASAGAVTIMSIHKSKGLEFPVVFVCGLSKSFNKESARGQVLCDQHLGVGLGAVEEQDRVRYPTIAKRAVSAKIGADGLSEEMRVLYVALTRARDRLIMTYASASLEKELEELVARMDMTDQELLTLDASCPGEWVLMAALRRTEAGELFRLGGYPEYTAPGQPAWLIRVTEAPAEQAACGSIAKETQALFLKEELEQIRKGLSFTYAHTAATQAPSKQTATQRKGRYKDEEIAELTQPKRQAARLWRKPSFAGQDRGATAQGTAVHSAMQYICFENCVSVEAVVGELDRLVQEQFLTREQAAMVNCREISDFFQTDLGKKLQEGGEILREFKFSVLDDGTNYAAELTGEKILLQGVVDCALIEEDGITVLDFKTDSVTELTLEATVERYRDQVQAYADAMQRIFQKPVKQALLYFFRMNTFVTVDQKN